MSGAHGAGGKHVQHWRVSEPYAISDHNSTSDGGFGYVYDPNVMEALRQSLGSQKGPEYSLWMTAFIDGFEQASGIRKVSWALECEALAWLEDRSERTNWPCGFEWYCDILDLNAEAVRKKVYQLRELYKKPPPQREIGKQAPGLKRIGMGSHSDYDRERRRKWRRNASGLRGKRVRIRG